MSNVKGHLRKKKGGKRKVVFVKSYERGAKSMSKPKEIVCPLSHTKPQPDICKSDCSKCHWLQLVKTILSLGGQTAEGSRHKNVNSYMLEEVN
jgi:hypothetical protein